MILEPISEYQVPFSLLQMCPKSGTLTFSGLQYGTCSIILAHDVAYTYPPKTKSKRGNCHYFIEKNFWKNPFSEKYSNGPQILLKWHISKMTKIDPRICLKVPNVQMWQKIKTRSVLNCWSKVAILYAITCFKCKPPMSLHVSIQN